MISPRLENLNYEGKGDLETVDCPLCGGKSFRTLVVENGLPVVTCGGCSLVFVNPRPSAQVLKAFYDHYFPPESEALWQRQMADVFLKEGAHAIEHFRKGGKIRIPQKARLLDIGCGMGFFLDLMKRRGFDTFGIELSKEAVKHAREKLKLSVFEGRVEEASLEGKFDVVTLWYVLEHVPNPHEILERVSQIMNREGFLIIRVPNQNAPIDQGLDRLGLGRFFLINPPRHLFDYGPKTLSAFLGKYGFEILEIRNSMPRSTGTGLELFRRFVWYGFFQLVHFLSGGKIIRGSSMTVYAKKK